MPQGKQLCGMWRQKIMNRWWQMHELKENENHGSHQNPLSR